MWLSNVNGFGNKIYCNLCLFLVENEIIADFGFLLIKKEEIKVSLNLLDKNKNNHIAG
jgi:hypothetical protein